MREQPYLGPYGGSNNVLVVVKDVVQARGRLSRPAAALGFSTSTTANIADIEQYLNGTDVTLLVFDTTLGNEVALDLCRRVRIVSNIPIVILFGSGNVSSRVAALDAGADDCFTEPFGNHELEARIRAVLRRAACRTLQVSLPRQSSVMAFKGWRLDLQRRWLLSAGGKREPLTGGEFLLLVAFCAHPNRVLTRTELLRLTGRSKSLEKFRRSIDIRVSRLRRRIECDPAHPLLIKTIRASGYLFTPEVIRT